MVLLVVHANSSTGVSYLTGRTIAGTSTHNARSALFLSFQLSRWRIDLHALCVCLQTVWRFLQTLTAWQTAPIDLHWRAAAAAAAVVLFGWPMLLTNCRVRLIQFTSITISSHSSGHLFRLLAHHGQFSCCLQCAQSVQTGGGGADGGDGHLTGQPRQLKRWDEKTMEKERNGARDFVSSSLVTEECQTEAAIICPNSGRDSIWLDSMSPIASNCQSSMLKKALRVIQAFFSAKLFTEWST